jgi:hypothetical protein
MILYSYKISHVRVRIVSSAVAALAEKGISASPMTMPGKQFLFLGFGQWSGVASAVDAQLNILGFVESFL